MPVLEEPAIVAFPLSKEATATTVHEVVDKVPSVAKLPSCPQINLFFEFLLPSPASRLRTIIFARVWQRSSIPVQLIDGLPFIGKVLEVAYQELADRDDCNGLPTDAAKYRDHLRLVPEDVLSFHILPDADICISIEVVCIDVVN